MFHLLKLPVNIPYGQLFYKNINIKNNEIENIRIF